MWQAERQCLVVVGAHQVLLALAAGGKLAADAVAIRPLAPLENSVEDMLAQLRHLLTDAQSNAAPNAKELVVLVSGPWLRWLSLPWSDSILDPGGSVTHAQQHFASAWGIDTSSSGLTMDDVAYGMPRLAATLEPGLLPGLRLLAQEHGLHLVRLQPLAVAAWCQARRREAGTSWILAMSEGGETTLMLVRDGRPVSVVDSEGPGQSPSSLLRRQVLRDPTWNEVDHVRYLQLDPDLGRQEFTSVPCELVSLPTDSQAAEIPAPLVLASAKTSSTLNFVATPAPVRGWRLSALAAGVILCGAVGVLAWNAQLRLEQAETEWASRRQVSLPQQSAADNRAEASRVKAANDAIRKLNVPVARLLKAVQPPADLRVALLGIEFVEAAGELPVLRISAEARSGAEMASYVGQLGDTRPFKGAYLVRHERTGDGGAKPYRFTVDAIWLE